MPPKAARDQLRQLLTTHLREHDSEAGSIVHASESLSDQFDDRHENSSSGTGVHDADEDVEAQGSSEMVPFYLERIARLEARLAEVVTDKARVRTELETERASKAAQIAELERQLEAEIREVIRRQDQVEKHTPVLSQQIDAAKEQLGTVVISDAAYAELQRMPREQRSLADEVRLVMHEGMHQLKRENEALRLSTQASREAHNAISQELVGLRRDNARLKASLAEAAQASANDNGALSARVQRLQHELGQATMAAEVNQAKADMYDSLDKHVREVEEEVTRLRAEGVVKTALDSELDSLRSAHKDREHRLELLMMDKAYLTRETESLEARLVRATTERDDATRAHEETKKQYQELCQKLLHADDAQKASLERRIEHEVSRVREQARSDMAALRTESQAALQRETRMLRDMRDHAQLEVDRVKGELKDCRLELDDVLLRHRELQRKTDLEISSLTAELKMRSLDADRAQLMLAEKEAQWKQCQQQNEVLHEKVRVLTDSYYSLESERTRTVSELQAALSKSEDQLSHYLKLEAHLDDAVLRQASGAAGGVGDDSRALVGAEQGLPTSVQRRVQQSVALAARCAALEKERAAMARQCTDLQEELDRTKQELSKQRLFLDSGTSAPNHYMLQELRAAEAEAAASKDEVRRLKASLETQTAELQANRDKLRHMHSDLQVVLEQRSVLDSLKSGLHSVLAAQGQKRPLCSMSNRQTQ